jgi:hypothetical protein
MPLLRDQQRQLPLKSCGQRKVKCPQNQWDIRFALLNGREVFQMIIEIPTSIRQKMGMICDAPLQETRRNKVSVPEILSGIGRRISSSITRSRNLDDINLWTSRTILILCVVLEGHERWSVGGVTDIIVVQTHTVVRGGVVRSHCGGGPEALHESLAREIPIPRAILFINVALEPADTARNDTFSSWAMFQGNHVGPHYCSDKSPHVTLQLVKAHKERIGQWDAYHLSQTLLCPLKLSL